MCVLTAYMQGNTGGGKAKMLMIRASLQSGFPKRFPMYTYGPSTARGGVSERSQTYQGPVIEAREGGGQGPSRYQYQMLLKGQGGRSGTSGHCGTEEGQLRETPHSALGAGAKMLHHILQMRRGIEMPAYSQMIICWHIYVSLPFFFIVNRKNLFYSWCSWKLGTK